MEQLGRSATRIALPRSLCAQCLERSLMKSCQSRIPRAGLQGSDRIQRRFVGYIAPPGGQARPIEGYYAELLKKPLAGSTAATRTAPAPAPAPSPSDPVSETDEEDSLAKARVVFGSTLARPTERHKQIETASREVAGVVVPPKPEEPDNCCMSGCVNCVWDLYRDEMEEWAAKNSEARAKMQAQREGSKVSGNNMAGNVISRPIATTMDDDGGGSDTNWVEPANQDALFDDIPVGIREFMRTEKKLKERHKVEHAATV